MSASEAERAGLVSRVVAADRLMDEALDAAAAICSTSLPSIMMAKECVDRAFESPTGRRHSIRAADFSFAVLDARPEEGMGAFLETRLPAFKHCLTGVGTGP